MDDKKNNPTSNDKSITDTVEDLFDDFFAPKKPDESHDAKKREPGTASSEKVQEKIVADKPLPKRISPDKSSDIKKKIISPVVPPVKSVQQKISSEKPVVTKKIISPVQPGINKSALKQDISLKEKGSPKKDLIEKPGKNISVKREPKITKIKFREVFKKYLPLIIFITLIILLVILSMFIGKIVDYDGMFESLSIKTSSTSIPEPASINNNIYKKSIKILKDDKTDHLKESHAESNEIQGSGMIKPEQADPEKTLNTVLEKRSGVPSNDITANSASYPYSIYLGSYNSVTSVKELSSKYMKMGITSYWIKMDLGQKGVWYRLYAGCFQKREQADEYIKTWKLPDAESKNTKYANLIGTYISKGDAEKQKAYLEEKGHSAYIISYAKDGFLLYTGAFYQQEQAEAQKTDLESNGIKSIVVER
ncbi:MAG: SPOR domain-containing protein [Deltaproteobacteria bacterium]|nr:SPOR domain-containing protein [Deltaproteobacteria bacterium]